MIGHLQSLLCEDRAYRRTRSPAWIWIRVNVRFALGYELENHVPLSAAAWYVALIAAMTTLAGWVAARHATHERILDGIRAD